MMPQATRDGCISWGVMTRKFVEHHATSKIPKAITTRKETVTGLLTIEHEAQNNFAGGKKVTQ